MGLASASQNERTPLVQMSDDAQALAYAIGHGAGYRRDGVGSPWHERTWIGSKKYAAVKGFAENWKSAPVVFEWFGPYDFLMRRKWSFDRAVEFMLAGASAVEVGTAIRERGFGVYKEITTGIDGYLEANGFNSVKEIVGLAQEAI